MFIEVKIKKCSLGMKQRIGIAMALPFEPGTAGVRGLVMCMLAKIFLAVVFVAIFAAAIGVVSNLVLKKSSLVG